MPTTCSAKSLDRSGLLVEARDDIAKCLRDLFTGELDGDEGDDGDQDHKKCVFHHSCAFFIHEPAG